MSQSLPVHSPFDVPRGTCKGRPWSHDGWTRPFRKSNLPPFPVKKRRLFDLIFSLRRRVFCDPKLYSHRRQKGDEQTVRVEW